MLFFFLVVLEFELRASYFLEPLHLPCFVLSVFEIGSHELFAPPGLKL
jgi:hypothetical protein